MTSNRNVPTPSEAEDKNVLPVAKLIGQIGSPGLPAALDEMLHNLVPFDLSVIFCYAREQQPILLHDGYGHHASPSAIEHYLAGAYLLDPFYTASVHEHPCGLWRMRDLAPDDFFHSDFYGSTEVHPCISLEPGSLVEEIGYILPLPVGMTAVYSLMRKTGQGPFNELEFARLKKMEPIVSEAMRAHWRDLKPSSPRPPSDGVIELAFAYFCHGQLTYQQQRIVQLILRGHSTASISEVIGVAHGTVKIHRQNIYRRLAISSQSELFNLFIQSLIQGNSKNHL